MSRTRGGQPGRPGPLDQPQALVGRPDPVADLRGVQVEGQAEEADRVPGAQHAGHGLEAADRDAEPAHRPVGRAEPGHPHQRGYTREILGSALHPAGHRHVREHAPVPLAAVPQCEAAASAGQERREFRVDTPPQVQDAHAGDAEHLVPGEHREIGIQRRRIHRHVPGALAAVEAQADPGAGLSLQFFQRRQRAEHVVHVVTVISLVRGVSFARISPVSASPAAETAYGTRRTRRPARASTSCMCTQGNTLDEWSRG